METGCQLITLLRQSVVSECVGNKVRWIAATALFAPNSNCDVCHQLFLSLLRSISICGGTTCFVLNNGYLTSFENCSTKSTKQIVLVNYAEQVRFLPKLLYWKLSILAHLSYIGLSLSLTVSALKEKFTKLRQVSNRYISHFKSFYVTFHFFTFSPTSIQWIISFFDLLLVRSV